MIRIRLSANQKKIAHAAVIGLFVYLADPTNYNSVRGLLHGLIGAVAARVAGALLAMIDTAPRAAP